MKRLIELAAQQPASASSSASPSPSFGLIKQKLGRMMVDCYAAESVVNMVAGLIDRGFEDYAVEAAISQGVRQRGAVADAPTRRCRSPAARATCASCPTSACCATPHQPDLRGHQRDPAPVHRAHRDERRRQPAQGAGRLAEGRVRRSDQGLRRARASTPSAAPRSRPASGGPRASGRCSTRPSPPRPRSSRAAPPTSPSPPTGCSASTARRSSARSS